jgi:hypothetical protein
MDISTQPEPTRSADPTLASEGEDYQADDQHTETMISALSMRHRLAGHILGRTRVAVIAVIAATTLAVAALSAPASASLYPTTTASKDFGDCKLFVGTHPDPAYYAVGGATIQCSRRHGYTIATVHLWRWNGTQWVHQASGSSTFKNSYGFGTRELNTAPGFAVVATRGGR